MTPTSLLLCFRETAAKRQAIGMTGRPHYLKRAPQPVAAGPAFGAAWGNSGSEFFDPYFR